MKKVNITTGHSPVIGDYTLQLQDAIADAMKGIMSANGNSIISGCEVALISGTDYSVSEGWLVWGGEVMHVPAHTVSNPSSYPIVVYKSLTTINNPINYEDGLSKDLAVITEAKFKAASAPATGEALLTDFDNQWITATPAGTWSAPNLKYRRIGNKLQIKGSIVHPTNVTAGTGGSVVTTLPSGYYPAVKIEGALKVTSGDVYAGWWEIDTGGSLKVGNFTGTPALAGYTSYLFIEIILD